MNDQICRSSIRYVRRSSQSIDLSLYFRMNESFIFILHMNRTRNVSFPQKKHIRRLHVFYFNGNLRLSKVEVLVVIYFCQKCPAYTVKVMLISFRFLDTYFRPIYLFGFNNVAFCTAVYENEQNRIPIQMSHCNVIVRDLWFF